MARQRDDLPIRLRASLSISVFLILWKGLMVSSFRDSIYRLPNFGIDGAIPEYFKREQERGKLPIWIPPIPGPLPEPIDPWPRPPSPPLENAPFPDVPRRPAPSQPRSRRTQEAARLDAIDWILSVLDAYGRQDAVRRGDADNAWAPPDPIERPRSWPVVGPDSDFIDRLPFSSKQASALQQEELEDLMRSRNNEPSGRRAIPPPIFFPFD
jgi:hypothetical protein